MPRQPARVGGGEGTGIGLGAVQVTGDIGAVGRGIKVAQIPRRQFGGR